MFGQFTLWRKMVLCLLGALCGTAVEGAEPQARFTNYVVMRNAGTLKTPEGKSLPILGGDVMVRLKSSDGVARVAFLRLGELGDVGENELIELCRAGDYFSGLLRKERDRPELFLARSRVWEALGQYRLALSDAGRAIELAPNDADAHIFNAIALGRIGSRDLAIVELDKAIALEPRNPIALVERGLARYVIGNVKAAEQDFELAATLMLDSPLPRVRRGQMYLMSGRYDEAQANFKFLAQRYPRNFLVMVNYAFLRATARDDKFRDSEQAMKLAHVAIDATGGKVGEVTLALAAAQASAGDFESAVATAETALANTIPRAEISIKQALKLFQQRVAMRIP